MVRNIDHDETPHIILGQGEYQKPVHLGKKPKTPAPPMATIESFADLYHRGKADAAKTERDRTNAAFFSAIILCLALGFAAGFSLASNLHAEPQQVAEVGE